jgi:hypothetical protein
MATDRFVVVDWPNGFFGALVPNNGSWSSQVCHSLEMLAPNLTLGVGSNKVTEKPPLVGANFVPIKGAPDSVNPTSGFRPKMRKQT